MTDRTVSIQEVARRLGVSTDTVRTYEREGRLVAERSPGGHRRFRESVIDGFLSTLEKPAVNAQDEEDENLADDVLQLPPRMEMPDWELRVREARADVEITKAVREAKAVAAIMEEEEHQRDERHAAAFRAQAESARLTTLRLYGRRYVRNLGAPTTYVARVVADLNGWVSSVTCPAYLPDEELQAFIRDRVDQLLVPWRRVQEQEAKQAIATKTRERLIEFGKNYAVWQTLGGWDYEPRREAIAKAGKVLVQEVDEDWTEDDVRSLVDDVLAGWE